MAVRRSLGFTLIEILIAIVVLVLGITGILALFPTAINSGNKTVEDSYSAAITQSVVDAIAVGLRESRYTYLTQTRKQLWTYFIFDHDGVIDRAPASPEDYEGQVSGDKMWLKDYCILLPRCKLAVVPAQGNKDRDREPVFIYPVPNTNSTGAGAPGTREDQRHWSKLDDPGGADSVIDNFEDTYRKNTTTSDTPVQWVSRVYQLGRYRDVTAPPLPTNMNVGDIRLEYRGEDLVNPVATGTGADAIAIDPYPTYGFCFAIKRARVDTAGGPPRPGGGDTPDGMVSPGNESEFPGRGLPSTNPPADAFSNSLYELRIMIFKNFSPELAKDLAPSGSPTGAPGAVVPKTNVPIKQFITLISI